MQIAGPQNTGRDPATGPELRTPGAAAQTRMVSVAKILLDPPKSTRLFKGIICDDISEFESHMPSHTAVRNCLKVGRPRAVQYLLEAE
jgi:hypothetical protein